MTQLTEMLNHDVRFIFPSIVIEELQPFVYNKNFMRNNAVDILRFIIDNPGKVIISNITNVEFFSWKANNDNMIINTALKFNNEYDITVLSCDKELIIKAMSANLDTKIIQPNVVRTPLIVEEFAITKVIQINKESTLSFSRKNQSYFLKNVTTDIKYYNGSNGLTYGKEILLRPGLIIYIITKNKIKKVEIINAANVENNIRILKTANLNSEATTNKSGIEIITEFENKSNLL